MKTKRTVKLHSLKTAMLAIGIVCVVRLANAQCVPPPAGIIAWWPGEGNANDIVGTNNGTTVNGAGYTPGVVGSAFSFNGVNQWVEIPDSPELNYAVGAPGTIEVWAFRTSSASPQHLVGKRGAGNFYQLAIGGGAIPSAAVPLNQWVHLAIVWNGSVYSHFVNGVIVQSSAYSGGIGPNSDPLRIGTSGGFAPFAGLIDEVGIYHRALTTNEIAAIYAAGSVGKCKLWITSQPQSQVGYWGKSVSFSITASTLRPPLTYQWMVDSAPILGATNAILVLSNLQFTNAGTYLVVVTDVVGNTTNSAPATLKVNAADLAIALYPGVKIDGVVGLTYGIQSNTNLANTNSWIGRTNLTLSVTPVIWSDYQPSPSQTFYRVLPGPIPIP